MKVYQVKQLRSFRATANVTQAIKHYGLEGHIVHPPRIQSPAYNKSILEMSSEELEREMKRRIRK